MDSQAILKELITLSHELGSEARGLAILGEGNTSASCGDGTFFVKASGSQLGTIDERGFSRVSMQAVSDLINSGPLTEQQIEDGLLNVLAEKGHRKPSVETFLHSLCLSLPDVNWVGHTHPVSVNSILCSKMGAQPFLQSIFPDQIVVCGTKPIVLPYINPGADLALALQAELKKYLDANGRAPRMILMENHGLVALGKTAKDVLNIQLMADKSARIILGTFALGGPKFMVQGEVERIDNRLDEVYRRKVLEGK